MNKPSTKPLGWFVGLGVLLITLGVIVGLIGIFVAAKRKQKYREDENSIPATNELPARPHSASNLNRTNDMVRLPGRTARSQASGTGRFLSLQ